MDFRDGDSVGCHGSFAGPLDDREAAAHTKAVAETRWESRLLPYSHVTSSLKENRVQAVWNRSSVTSVYGCAKFADSPNCMRVQPDAVPFNYRIRSKLLDRSASYGLDRIGWVN